MSEYESRPIRSLDMRYTHSSLEEWFRLDVWRPKEAMCLICDIDPDMADIDWPDNDSVGPGFYADGPTINNALLLSKSELFYYLPRHFTAEEKARYDSYSLPLEDIDPKKLSEEDRHLVEIADKIFELAVAEDTLKSLWIIFGRAKDAKEIDSSGTDPQWYVQWALKRGFKIPWLDWAEQHGFLAEESITEIQGDNDVPKPLTPSDERREEALIAAKMILREKRASGELNDLQDFETCMRKSIVIDYIRSNRTDFPCCDSRPPPLGKNESQSIKEREPTLYRNFPDFTKTEEIVEEYDRLTAKK